jgi:type 2 lantibiotic biosynthesis protein LanM
MDLQVLPAAPEQHETGPSHAPSSWLGSAEQIGDHLAGALDTSTKHGLLWRDPSKIGAEPEALGPHLYDGVCGVALSLAGLARITADPSRASLARTAVMPLRRQLGFLAENPDRAARLDFRLGATSGLGGYVYSFLRLSDLLADETFLETAETAASLITPERIAADRSLDVSQGSAGAILALLALASRTARTEAVARAVLCGEHLLANSLVMAPDPLALGWSANGYPPWCGFSHGAAGIATALTRLAEATGREDFLTAAVAAATFERGHFDANVGNWRDLRGLADRYMIAWCHGAPGIVLSRLDLWRASPSPAIEADLRAALRTTRDTPRLNRDTLCCGNLGRADILLHAAAVLDDEDLRAAAHALTDDVIRHADRRGYFRCALEGHTGSPAFFTGWSGIGYGLLRSVAPSRLPSVLAFA